MACFFYGDTMNIFERWKHKIKSCFPPHPSNYPVIADLAAFPVSSGVMQVFWTTDIPSTSQVFYGKMPMAAIQNYLPSKSDFDGALVTDHLVTISGLEDHPTLYRLRPQSFYRDSLTLGPTLDADIVIL